MWDTKSKEDVYSFPNSHLRQFKRYTRDAERRVGCFLVIVPEIAAGTEPTAVRLKAESKTDTDVALIPAEDLHWLAEQWAGRSGDEPFDLEAGRMTDR